MTTLTAIRISEKNYRIMRGTLRIGSVFQARFDGTWTSSVNAFGMKNSRAPHPTAEICARARWGAAGAKAIINATEATK